MRYNIVVTILTGRRPKLLKQTLESILDKCPELLEDNTVIVLNNAYDRGTNEVLKEYDFIDEVIVRKKTVSIGRAMTILAEAAKKSGKQLWLMLEDDWQCMSSDWVKEATKLASNNGISQVRLRLDSEKVLTRHMITGEPINWKVRSGFKISNNAHLTFNPSIIKARDIDNIFPCTGERHAQKNWLENGMGKVVQLTPGVFQHIGEGQSLRELTRCEL